MEFTYAKRYPQSLRILGSPHATYALVSARIPLKGVFSVPPRICMYTCMYTQFIGFRETAGCGAAVAFWLGQLACCQIVWWAEAAERSTLDYCFWDVRATYVCTRDSFLHVTLRYNVQPTPSHKLHPGLIRNKPLHGRVMGSVLAWGLYTL